MSDELRYWLVFLAAHKEAFSVITAFLGVVGGAVGLGLLVWRTWATAQQARAALLTAKTALDRHISQTQADLESRVTDAFARATEQLASEKLAARLGAIYTLERIQNDSVKDYWPIMEILSAYVRETWRIVERHDDEPEHDADIAAPPADIHAILTVIGRRNERARVIYQSEDQKIDLYCIDLRSTSFAEKSNFQEINFDGNHLENAGFWDTNLKGARFVEANLSGAAFCAGTVLHEVNFGSAVLVYAYMSEAVFDRNNFHRADLTGTYIAGVDLRSAYNLTQEQIDVAYGDKRTRLPSGLRHPAHWPDDADFDRWRRRRELPLQVETRFGIS